MFGGQNHSAMKELRQQIESKKLNQVRPSNSTQVLFGKTCHGEDYDDFFRAIRKASHDRSSQDVFLIKLMLRQVEALQSIPSHSMDRICRYIRRKKIKQGQLVAQKGDIASECFVVASGNIDVEIKVPDKKNMDKLTTVVVFQFKPGDFFGDYGLQEASATRTADCRAKTLCEVLTIPKSVYCKYMLHYMHGNRDLKKEYFVKKLANPIYPSRFLDVVTDDSDERFKEYDKILTEQMNWMVCKSFTKGSVIGLQGHPSRSLYFVAQGVVRCLKTIYVNGKPLIIELGKYQKGQSFGAQFAKIEEKNIHSWVAEGPVTLYMIGKSDYKKLFKTNCVRLYAQGTNQLEISQARVRKSLKQQADWAYYKKQLIRELNEGCDLSNASQPMHLPKHVRDQMQLKLEQMSETMKMHSTVKKR